MATNDDPPEPPPPLLSSLLLHNPLLDDSEVHALEDFLDRVGNGEASFFDPKLPPLASSLSRNPSIDEVAPASGTHLQWGSDRAFDLNGYSIRPPPPPSSGAVSPEIDEGRVAPWSTTIAPSLPRMLSESSSSYNTPSPHTGGRDDRPDSSFLRVQNLSEQEKRENHIHSEQKRRQLIKDGFADLDQLVPGLHARGMSKSQILTETADFIVALQEEILQLRETLRPQTHK